MEPIKIYDNPPRDTWSSLTARVTRDDGEIAERVAAILTEVRGGGDKALRRIAERVEDFVPERFELPESLLQEAACNIPPALKAALATAKANIEAFHRAQLPRPVEIETMPGVRCLQRAVPIRRVGLYIPGGKAPLFSTVLMLAVPAVIAGCSEIILCTPAGSDGRIAPEIRYAATLCGVRRVFAIGGAQAVAAMAYGTESVPRVDKIFGPGNRYVTRAKQLVSVDGVAIDLPAGPSEVLVLADEGTSPDFAAADLLSQAEHDALASAICITDNEALAHAVIAELERQSATLPRADIVRKSLADWSAVVLVPDMDAAIALANRVAPEHLEVLMREPWSVLPRIRHAGAVFLGPYAPEPLGDYFAGPNHVLPTLGTARFSSALSVQTFCKRTSIIAASPAFAAAHADAVARLARMEQLEAHARSMECRKQ